MGQASAAKNLVPESREALRAAFQSVDQRISGPYASTAAISAIAATDQARTDGCVVTCLADSSLWVFDASSVAGAGANVLVPDAGSGRWLRVVGTTGGVSATDLASTANAKGASLVGIEDAATKIVATTVEGALVELAGAAPQGAYAGGAITDQAANDVGVHSGSRLTHYTIAAISQGETNTLVTTDARAGDAILVTRTTASGAFTAAFVNGGPGAGTIATFPASKMASALFVFDGTNWAMWSCGAL